MEAINFITDWSYYLLYIVPSGAVCRIAYLNFKKQMNNNDGVIGDCNSKINNTIIASIIAFSITGIIQFLKSYYL